MFAPGVAPYQTLAITPKYRGHPSLMGMTIYYILQRLLRQYLGWPAIQIDYRLSENHNTVCKSMFHQQRPTVESNDGQ